MDAKSLRSQFGIAKFIGRNPEITVFIVNFCIMTLELVAGRMVAPFVGVSLYTWTAVIGIILLGMSVGNYYGGKLADMQPSGKLLGYLLLGSGFLSLTTILLLYFLGPGSFLPGIPYIFQVFLITSIFLLPAVSLGSISPVLVKLSVQNLEETGKVVGKIYAASALGGIVGTYMTGFYLISTFGVILIVAMVGVLLFLLSFFYINPLRLLRKADRKELFLFVILGSLLLASTVLQGDFCQRESNYYCIRISEDKEGKIKRLILDKLTHSITDMEDPLNMEYEYERLAAAIYDYLGEDNQVLMLGGGGYTLPRYFVHRYQNPDVVVVEIDPLVSEIAFEEFDMPRDSSVETVNIDARIHVSRLSEEEKFDLIFADTFSDFSIPYHLTTREFSEMVSERLRDGGFYVVNVIDNLDPGLFLRAYVNTMLQVFEKVYLFEPGIEEEDREERFTYVVVAGDQELDMEKLEKTAVDLGFSRSTVAVFSQSELEEMVSGQGKKAVLTDDYAPVDNLIAPVHAESGYSFSELLSWILSKET